MWLQIVGEYLLYRDDQPTSEALHTASCRLLLDIMPGLETSVIFQDNVRTGLCYTFHRDLWKPGNVRELCIGYWEIGKRYRVGERSGICAVGDTWLWNEIVKECHDAAQFVECHLRGQCTYRVVYELWIFLKIVMLTIMYICATSPGLTSSNICWNT